MNQQRAHGSVHVLIALACGLVLSSPARSETGLDVQRYVATTVARLERAVAILETEKRALRTDEENGVFTEAGTSAAEYYGFATMHEELLHSYLEEHQAESQRIESLRLRIQAGIDALDLSSPAMSPTDPTRQRSSK